MDQQRIDAELSHEGARELLASTAAAHLAYVAKDGTPRVIPVGFYWTGEEFVVSTATTSPKLAALSQRPDVSLAIDTGDTPDQARSLSIRGRAEVTIVDGLVPEYLAAARETMDADAAAEFERTCREMYDQQARIGIRPRWARFYDFGTGRMPQFLQELAAKAGS
jgi:PPOX class probable F420-dependent enzyme